MQRVIAALMVLALSACATPPPPAQTSASDPAPGTMNVRMGGELGFFYGVHSGSR